MRYNLSPETVAIESKSQTKLRYKAVLTLSIFTYHSQPPYNTIYYFTTYLTKQIN
jgi:hypothetical protein